MEFGLDILAVKYLDIRVGHTSERIFACCIQIREPGWIYALGNKEQMDGL